MNHPDSAPVDIEEMREWLGAFKLSSGRSWDRLGEQVGRAGGTLQPFCQGTYKGKNEEVAKIVFRFRQTMQASEDRAIGIPADPGYFETETSAHIATLLSLAQARGRITFAATGPGTGKTKTANHYAECNSNVWVATMRESTRTLTQMLWEVARAVGEPIRASYSSGASRTIQDKVRGRKGLIVIDEANCLATDSLEEIRSWNDLAGVGICLLGNEELAKRIGSGSGHALARLNSRIAQSLTQNQPTERDVIAFCDAWAIEDAGMRRLLTDVAMRSSSGGLRECAMIVETASDLAMSDERPLSLSDLKDARDSRTIKIMRS